MLLCVGIVIDALGAPIGPTGDVLVGLGVLVGGAIDVIPFAGRCPCSRGIHDGVRWTAEAVERLAER